MNNMSLIKAVGKLHTAQKKLNAANNGLTAARAKYAARKALVELSAYTAELFPDGKGGMRAARNDSERDTAIQIKCDQDAELTAVQVELRDAQAKHAEAQTELDWRQNLLTVQKDIVRLHIAELNTTAAA